ncbi:uncharacterized protein LOC111369401 [Olea europaea var. sylvestris]|uniref:Uncharacterized protein LOC111369401 n=1 Tax=Olea europaea subsp. europaea TaxID=158383 RepID=A0A8S0PJ61_OLEEU|nr:uncharacterized protein LOC111369401 [Olea europaea var. sylvestris]CAA2953903.1 uncharacterized protein LOC111369401 [Olea europaea subsp. europaea]
MGRGRRRQILIALGLVMLMGIAVYLRLWTIDYRISSSETELLRKQFDLANREAMDESAEWRQRFDAEVEKTSTCYKDLSEIKESLRHKAGDSVGLKKKLEILQKENMDLLERVESLKQELESEKLKCSMRQI